MSALWAWFVGTRVGRWIVGVALTLAALGAALAVAFVKGKQHQADADKARDAQSLAEAAEQAVKASTVRKEIENATAKLPDAPPQRVGDAYPDTAAGKLRDDGWTRD